MKMFNVLCEILSDKPEMNHLLIVDSKAFVSYLRYIVEKLNLLNKELQGYFGFVSFIEVC